MLAERRARARLDRTGPAELQEVDRLDLERALATLPRRQREAVVLRYYLGMDTREVAEALRVNEGTVKRALFRARATLAQALGVPETEEANDLTKLDEHLRRELERAGRPADPTGVYEELIRRRERRQIAPRLEAGSSPSR